MQTILLTGATGFLGSHLLDALVNNGNPVVILKRSTSDTWRIGHLLSRIKAYDIDKEPLERAFREQHIDTVIHTACSYGRDGEAAHSVVATNLIFGLRLLEEAIQAGTAAFINTDSFFSSEKDLSRYLNSYSLSKRQFVEWLKSSSERIKTINLRIEHMYGPMDENTKFIPWLIKKLDDNCTPIELTKGDQERDFIYVSDVVSAYLHILENIAKFDMWTEFNAGSGEIVTLRNMIKILFEKHKEITGATSSSLKFGALPYREGELMKTQSDNKKLIESGWQPKISLENGLKETIRLALNDLRIYKKAIEKHKDD